MRHVLAPIAPPGRRGFTLIEVIVAVAIVAVLAGAITPMVFRELMQAREDATVRELDAHGAALLDFYEDTGRLPTSAEGLGALVTDPGAPGWQGPYVAADRGDPVEEVTTDAFGHAYVYEPAPRTDPLDAADAVIVSAGSDGAVTSGRPGATWSLAGDGDDLVAPLTLGPLNRANGRRCQQDLAALADACRAYFEDHAAFPAQPGDLVPDYLDGGVAGAALEDPWSRPYLFVLQTGGAQPDQLLILSTGPDRQADAGGDDDVALTVSSVPPGRRTSLWKLEIAQTALNSSPSLVLTGAWASDRAALGLDPAFTTDGWGRTFAVNVTSRTVFSVGPDGNAALVQDNLPAGVGP